jgi:hypothetical protein
MELPSRNSESNYIKQFARYMYKRPKMTQTQEFKNSYTKTHERPTCPEQLQFAKEQKERKMGIVGTSSKVGGRDRGKRRERGIAC